MAAQASGNNGKVNNAKAAKFDQLLKVSQSSRQLSTYNEPNTPPNISASQQQLDIKFSNNK